MTYRIMDKPDGAVFSVNNKYYEFRVYNEPGKIIITFDKCLKYNLTREANQPETTLINHFVATDCKPRTIEIIQTQNQDEIYLAEDHRDLPEEGLETLIIDHVHIQQVEGYKPIRTYNCHDLLHPTEYYSVVTNESLYTFYRNEIQVAKNDAIIPERRWRKKDREFLVFCFEILKMFDDVKYITEQY